MKPAEKSPVIDGMLKAAGFDRRGAITGNVCVLCKKPANFFRDNLSRREYTISGMCQTCQDKVFGTGEEE